MITVKLVLFLLAFISFVLAAVGVQTTRISLMPLGLAFWILGVMIS